MAQSTLGCFPLRVSLFWEKRPEPELDCHQWLSNVNYGPAIMVKDNAQAAKLLPPSREQRIILSSSVTLRTSTTWQDNSREKAERAKK